MSTYDVFPNEAGYRRGGASASIHLVKLSVSTRRNHNWAGPEGTSGPTISIDHFIKGYGEDIVDNF